MSDNSEKERVRVALNMLRSDYEDLKELAEADKETVSGYLRKALATERYLKESAQKGGKVLIEEDGVLREIVFR
jgi:endonuclease III